MLKKKKDKKFLKTMEPYLWLLPAFILFGAFTFYPFIETIFKSFFIVDSFGNVNRFVGLENYMYILSDEKFVQAIFPSVWYKFDHCNPISLCLMLTVTMQS